VPTTPPPGSPPASCLPAWAWAALAVVLGFVYLRGIASDPLRWEEPRRALVAAEMIHRGDYVVPRLLGEPYLNKPPMHGWLVVLLAGFDAGRVSSLAVRLPSVLAVASISLLLLGLGIGARSGPHPLPALVFLTLGILPQYGRPGEIDLPFALWVTAALAAFEAGRRRGSGALQWVASQGLVAGGVLTKGFAPLFFHPPAIAAAWRRRLPERPFALLAGALLMLALVALWVVPYALSGPVRALGERLTSEVAQRTTPAGAQGVVRHLLLYPLVLAAAAAPWSLLLAAAAARRGRAALRGLLEDPWLALCAASTGWGVFVFLFVPGTLPRYLIPVLPPAAVLVAAALARLDRPSRAVWPWAVLAAAWAAAAPLAARRELGALPAEDARLLAGSVGALGLLAVAAASATARRFGRVTAALLAAGLLYGVAFAGIAEPRAAFRHRAFVAAAEALAPRVRPAVPLVVAEGTDRRFTWPLARRLGRLVVESPPEPPYDFVASRGTEPPGRARQVAESGGFALWRVRAARPGKHRRVVARDEDQVARVHEEAERLAEDEDGVAAPDRVGEEQRGPAEAQPPERGGHDALPPPLRGDPLHQEAGREQQLPREAHRQPPRAHSSIS
jgi:4-amino-4-deoxy-L-arabinose transferase-like glycosyltransferase